MSTLCPLPLLSIDSDLFRSHENMNTYLNGTCALSLCNNAFGYNTSQWSQASSIHLVTSLFSFFSSLFLTVTWFIVNADKRGQLVHYLMMALTLVYLPSIFILSTNNDPYSNHSTLRCKSEFELFEQGESRVCTAEAVFSSLFAHLAIHYLLCSILDIALFGSSRGNSWTERQKNIKALCYHSFSWIFALIPVITNLGQKNFGATTYSVACWSIYIHYN
jgi:hypothetical protein